MAMPANVPSIDEIRQKTRDTLGITPCLWQAEIAQAVLRRDKDIISVAGTGSGKTLTFWMPLLFRPQGIQIVVTPLNILGKQQVTQLAKAGIKAIPLSGETATHEKYKAIEDGRYRAVVISPEEMLKKDGGFMKLLANDIWASQIISVIWDEGHCIGPSSWGSFRPAYKDAARLRHLLPRHIPYYITSATLDDRAVSEIISTLQLQRDRLVQFRYSNDRPNIRLTVRKMAHSMRSYRDLAFLIPKDWKEGDKTPKFLVFFDSIADSVAAARVLRQNLPPHLRCNIKWFNSEMSSQFRDKSQAQYKEGGVWGLYCTDSFGMGVDLPDIELVVQWRATCDMRTLWQRFGRAARDPTKTAKALLLAEPKWFDADQARRKAAAERREVTRLAKRKAVADGATEPRAKKKRAVAASSLGVAGRIAQAVDEGEGAGEDASDGSDSEDEAGNDEVENGADVPAVAVRDEAERQQHYQQLREVYKESRLAEERSNRVRTKLTKKPQELTAEMDNLVNASSRPHKCFRVPIMAFFAQDQAKSSHRRCRPDLPAGCPRCNIITSRICCELCSPTLFKDFARVDAAPHTKSSQGPRSRIDKLYKMTDREKTLSLELHAFRKRRTAEQLGQAQLLDMGPSAFMPNVVLKRIVDCARVQKLETTEQLLKETQWKASDDDQAAVVAIVAKIFPPTVTPLMTNAPLVRAPLAQRRAGPNDAGAGEASGSAQTQAGPDSTRVGRAAAAPITGRRCGKCKAIGHIASNAQRCPLHPRYDPRPRRGRRNENEAPAAPTDSPSRRGLEPEGTGGCLQSPGGDSPLSPPETLGRSSAAAEPPRPSSERQNSPSPATLPTRPRPRPRPVPPPMCPRSSSIAENDTAPAFDKPLPPSHEHQRSLSPDALPARPRPRPRPVPPPSRHPHSPSTAENDSASAMAEPPPPALGRQHSSSPAALLAVPRSAPSPSMCLHSSPTAENETASASVVLPPPLRPCSPTPVVVPSLPAHARPCTPPSTGQRSPSTVALPHIPRPAEQPPPPAPALQAPPFAYPYPIYDYTRQIFVPTHHITESIPTHRFYATHNRHATNNYGVPFASPR